MSKKIKKVSSLDELLKFANKIHGEDVRDGIESTDWNDVELYSNMPMADFVEKRFMGMTEYDIAVEHEINRIPFRMEHIADSPRKTAAQVVWEKYRDCYERLTDLNLQQIILDRAQTLLDNKECAADEKTKKDLRKKNSENALELQEMTERMRTYHSFMASFFSDFAVAKPLEDQQMSPAQAKAEQQVLQEIGEALPQGQEYDLYRNRAGYEEQRAMPMNPRAAVLSMNPNVITNITVDDFPDSVRGDAPSKLNREWGASTFDAMMEGIYNQGEWKTLKKDKKNLLNTVFLDGKPATSFFNGRIYGESEIDYERRVKSGIVAYALEGKGRIDVVPLKKNNGQYEFQDPIPVRVNVNIPEKVSRWNRFLRVFNLKKFETKKEKAERISMEDLNREEHLEQIRRHTAEMIERENHSARNQEIIRQAEEREQTVDHDFFGFMIKDEKGITDEAKAIDQKMQKAIFVPISAWNKDELKLRYPEAFLINNVWAKEIRDNLVRLHALSKGMSIEDVLSSDPALKERKEAIGREFVEIVSLKNERQFYEDQGPYEDYKAYYKDKLKKASAMIADLHNTLQDTPFDFFKGREPDDLMENYEKWHFFSTAAESLYSTTDRIKNYKREDWKEVEQKTMVILYLNRTLGRYCQWYLGNPEIYVNTAGRRFDRERVYFEALRGKLVMDYIFDRKDNVKKLGDLGAALDNNIIAASEKLMGKLDDISCEKNLTADIAHYLATGKDPLYYYDQTENQFIIDTPENIAIVKKHGYTTGNPERAAVRFEDFQEISIDEIERIQFNENPEKDDMMRRKVHNLAVEKLDDRRKSDIQGCEDFFGFLLEDARASSGEETKYKTTDSIVRDLAQTKLSPEMREKLGIEDGELIHAMPRESSRLNLVRLYAMTKGMSLQEVLSTDESMLERKSAIGREFMELIHVKSEEEYQKETGGKGDYESYYRDKAEKVYTALKDMHQVLHDMPYDFFEGSDPLSLVEHSEKWYFLSSAAMDLNQAHTNLMKLNHGKELDELENKTNAVAFIRDAIGDYCCGYLPSDLFRNPKNNPEEFLGTFVHGKIYAEKLVKDTKGITKLGDLSTVMDEQWGRKLAKFKSDLVDAEMQYGNKAYAAFLNTGKNPVCHYDEKKKEFVVDQKIIAQKEKKGPERTR